MSRQWICSFFVSFLLFNSCAVATEVHEQVVILGSGPAGLTAAIYTARAGLSTLVMEGEEPGGQISLSYAVENFPGFPEGVNGFELGQKMREQAKRFGAKIQGGKIIHADLSQRPFRLKTEEGSGMTADVLIIASGASAKWLGLESEKAFIGTGVSSCAVCDGFSFIDQDVVVVGGGDTALEDALFLTNYASNVTIVHRSTQLKASKYLQDKAFAHEKIRFILDHIVEEIADAGQGKVTHVSLKNVHTKERQTVPCEGVFIAIGHAPNSSLCHGQLELNPSGYIRTMPGSTKTNIPGVFAAGDIADSRYRQAVTAAGSGCMAGIDAYHFIQEMEIPNKKSLNSPVINLRPDLLLEESSHFQGEQCSSEREIFHRDAKKKKIEDLLTNQDNREPEKAADPTKLAIVHVHAGNIDELVNGEHPLIIDAYTSWCGPCKHMDVLIQELHQEFGDRYQFAKLNAEKEKVLAKSLRITAYPTVIFFHKGKEVGRQKGYIPKESFVKKMEQFFNGSKSVDQIYKPASSD